MKSIKESIIGRKGIQTKSENMAWIMFPKENDYYWAGRIFPEEYLVRVGNDYVFCIDDIQRLKRYFNGLPQHKFSSSYSILGVISSHFEDINRIKKWVHSNKQVEDIYQSDKIEVVKNIPEYIETL